MRLVSFTTTLGERINPIVIKELRQAVRSRYVIGVLMLFLILCLAVLGFALLDYDGQDLRVGREIFMILEGILFATCLLFVPAYTGVRLANERWQANIDLFFSTTLGTHKIVTGKFHASLLIMLLLYSACLPFLLLSYMLRGIDIPTMLVLLTFHFLLAATVLQAVIFIACIPCSRFFKILLGLLIGAGLVFVLGGVMGFSQQLIGRGVAGRLGSGEFWQVAGSIVCILAIAYGFAHVFSLSLLAPPHASRTVWIRSYTTVVWGLTGGASCLVFAVGGANWRYMIVAWAICSTIAAAVFLFVAVSERETYSLRIRRHIPHSRLLRFLMFPFYSGGAGGVLWATVIGGVSLAIFYWTYLLSRGLPHMHWEWRLVAQFTALFLYAFAYSQTGLLLRRLFLRKHVNPAVTWLLGILVMTLTITLSGIMFGLLRHAGLMQLPFHKSWLQLLNPFMLFNDDQRVVEHLALAASWAVVFGALNVHWFVSQVAEYAPLKDEG